ncbi:MAG: CIA30 family protein [Croceitalea sp.]|nr:CIA30 family protein [Croceitalea sp.]
MKTLVLFDFTPNSDLGNWQVVDDGVMGGRSKSELLIGKEGHGVFKGAVSLENNGGFSSVRLNMDKTAIGETKNVVLRIMGDGKKYQFRIKANSNDFYNYVAYFETSGAWETLTIPLASFYPNFRGRALDAPNFDKAFLQEIGILIGNKKAEQFRLEIDFIKLE